MAHNMWTAQMSSVTVESVQTGSEQVITLERRDWIGSMQGPQWTATGLKAVEGDSNVRMPDANSYIEAHKMTCRLSR